MAWSRASYETAFDAEAGDIVSLATQALKIIWFNEGQARLLKRRMTYTDLTWAAAARSVALPTDFVQLDKLVWNDGSTEEPWRVWGETLVLDDYAGASGAGGARCFYWAEFTEMVTGTTATDLNISMDYACLYFALHRFYKRLASNRAYYKRYSTLAGGNAVSMGDLQNEADRYYQDFLDAREDVEPNPPAYFYDR